MGMMARKVMTGSSGGVSITSPSHPDLVAMYTMDNISGSTLFDETSNSNDGTITGATQVAGKINNALFFGANSTDRVALPVGVEDILTGDFSLSFFVDYQSQSTSSPRFIVMRDDPNGFLFYHLPGTNEFGLGHVGKNTYTIPYTFTPGFRHIVLNYARSSLLEIFVDDVSVGSAVLTDTIPTGGSVSSYLGNEVSFNRVLNGSLDQFRIFKRILTPSERTALYNGGAGA